MTNVMAAMFKFLVAIFATGVMLASCATTSAGDAIAAEAPAAPAALQLSDLIGVWDVELYYNPSQPPSATVMEVTAIENGTAIGTFYGSPFESAEAVLHKGYIVFSAITSDGTGPYAHGMRMHAPNHIYGQTLSTGRGFLMPWEATRRTGDGEELE